MIQSGPRHIQGPLVPGQAESCIW